MSNGIYVALSKQTALFRHLDVVANNIANADTVGKKQDQVLYQQYIVKQPTKHDVSFANDVKTFRNEANGATQVTNRPLDIAIEGPGYFAIQTPNGIRYGRAGNFKLDQNMQLTTFDSNPVLDINNNPIVFEQNDKNISIDERGFIRSNIREIGQIAILDFPDQQSLESIGNNLYRTEQIPNLATNFRVTQFALEGSNVESVRELTNMITIQRDNELTANILNILEQLEQQSVESLAKTVK
ncbi:MAG: flagellar hook basal-body protein [Alphaproteobacteria bacterium]